jgi:BioD-like phosphotransacetylase family protein
MGVLYVTGKDSKVGKTTICATLISLAQSNDFTRISFLKPFVTNDKDKDSLIISKLCGIDEQVKSTKSKSQAIKIIKQADLDNDLVIVEGSHNLNFEDHKEIVSSVDAKVIVVADFLSRRTKSIIEFSEGFEEYLLGIIVNNLTLYGNTRFEEVWQPAFDKSKADLLGTIPEDRTLVSLTVESIANILNAYFYSGDEYKDNLVENFMVGGFGMDPGQYVFNTRNKKAVIVRGDRPDVQMSALETPMSCFIMTNGLEPIEYVQYECEEEKVPVLIVQENTLTIMDMIDQLSKLSKFDHPKKLEKAKQLMVENIKVEKIITTFGQLPLM